MKKYAYLLLLILVIFPGAVHSREVVQEGKLCAEIIAHDEKNRCDFVTVPNLYPDSDFVDFRFESCQGQNKTVLLHTFKAPFFIDSVRCSNYSVYFFEVPRIIPFGNIILGWRIKDAGSPELVFMSPFSNQIGLHSELIDLRRSGEFVEGKIQLRDEEHPDAGVLELEFTLSAEMEAHDGKMFDHIL